MNCREIRDKQDAQGVQTSRRTQTIFTLQSSAPNAPKLIDEYVGAALAHYKALMATKKEDARCDRSICSSASSAEIMRACLCARAGGSLVTQRFCTLY